MKQLLTLLVVGLLVCAGAALAADVSGVWKASMPGRDGGTMEMTFTLKASGETLTGTMGSQWGDTEISEGKVAGDMVSFKVKREFNGNQMVITYTGTVAGDEIKFKSEVEGSERPPREFVAKKSN
ncbi:MAG: hypothetical protein M9913_16030 [Bryobacteraceae bacterium]|nr:hypothetical protein [Solibacteraceae bacterium]MCO5352385.1 hypothetical protein [Bryobacteraceae bacterium]